MTISLKHPFTSPKADGTDATLVQPSNWNAEHTLTCASGKLLGRTTAGVGAVEELTYGDAATKNTGTTAGTVAAGDDSRITGAAQKASNLSDLASAATARTNLGLGTAAVQAVGTAAGDIPQLDAVTAKMPAVDGSTMTNLSTAAGFGTAATKNVGVAAGNVVQLDATTAKLPAVDGSLLTGINAVQIPTTSTFPVGGLAFVKFNQPSFVVDGATTAGSSVNLTIANDTGVLAGVSGAQSGTWRNVSGAQRGYGDYGMAVRIA